MNKIIIKLQYILLIILNLCISNNAYPNGSSETLITDHFYINFDTISSSEAAVAAGRLESYYESISAFLETEIKYKINVSILPANGEKSALIKNNKELYIISGSNWNDDEKILYHDLFELFLLNIFNTSRASSSINDMFINALINFNLEEPEFIKLVTNDLVNNCGIDAIEVSRINTLNKNLQNSCYIALIDFITSTYDKKTLTQAIKDADYYNDFYRSLSEITGDSINVISEKFSTYLKKIKSDLPADSYSKQTVIENTDNFTDISFSISQKGQIAVIQKDGVFYRILLKTGESKRYIVPVKSENESVFNDICFVENDKIALSEINHSGSVIQIYDLQTGNISGKTSLPYLFISKLRYFDYNKFIFSAGCGITNDIYSLDLAEGKFNIITMTGNNFYPLMQKDKLYCISKNPKSSIIEFDLKSGVSKTLFSTDQKVLYLDFFDEENLVFSMKLNGRENIYKIDLKSSNLSRLTDNFSSNIEPHISGKKLYYLSFYKSRYSLFSAELNQIEK